MTRALFIKVRVTPEEKEHYSTLAARAGLPLSGFIRSRLAGVRIRPAEQERERNRQLARIGNNLNQLARWANSFKGDLEAVRIIAALEDIRRAAHTSSSDEAGEAAHAD